MTKKQAGKSYTEMTDDELAEARIALDEQMQELRAEKKKIQDEIDRRYVKPDLTKGHTIGLGG